MLLQELGNVFIYVGATVVILSGLSLATVCSEGNVWGDDGSVGDSGCRETNHSPICSGRGTCECGECKCEERPDTNEIVSGQFCECTNFMCPRFNGLLCGGIGLGRCECNVCHCHQGWSGEDCMCSTGKDDCVNPETGEMCSGNGECECNQCKCFSSHRERYSGKYCEDCSTCRGHCATYKSCVQCQVFGTGDLTPEECSIQCTQFNATTVTKASPGEGERLCSYFDENECRFTFVYGYSQHNTPRVMVQSQLECPPPTYGQPVRSEGEEEGVDSAGRNECSILLLMSVITVIMYLCNV